MNILLVENNRAEIALAEEAFSEAAPNVVLKVVQDGEQAIHCVHGHENYKDHPRPDLILLDLNLPKVDGFAVLKELKGKPSTKGIPIIALTTSRSNQDILRAYENQVNGYIVKPRGYDAYLKFVNAIEFYWFNMVELPTY